MRHLPNCILVIMLSACAARPIDPEHAIDQRLSANKALVGIVNDPRFSMTLAAETQVPRDIEIKFRQLDEKVRAFAERWKRKAFIALQPSPSGKGIALFSQDWLSKATSVAVWPDWLDSERVLIYDHFTTAEFLSDQHVLLSNHTDRELLDLASGQSHVVSDPTLRLIGVDSNDEWLAVDSNHSLVSGEFRDLSAGRKGNVIAAQRVREAKALHDGDVLVVGTHWGNIEIYKRGAALPTHIIENLSITFPECREGLFALRAKNRVFLHVDASGRGTVQPKKWLGGLRNERPYLLSPDGDLVLTWIDTLIGGVSTTLRRVENGKKLSGVLNTPNWPNASLRGWLTWPPEKAQ